MAVLIRSNLFDDVFFNKLSSPARYLYILLGFFLVENPKIDDITFLNKTSGMDEIDLVAALQEIHFNNLLRYANNAIDLPFLDMHFVHLPNAIDGKVQRPTLHGKLTTQQILKPEALFEVKAKPRERRRLIAPGKEENGLSVAGIALKRSPGKESFQLSLQGIQPIERQEVFTKKEQDSLSMMADMHEIFEEWKSIMNVHYARLTPDRRKKILARLQKYSKKDIIIAIQGCAGSSFHMGGNDRHIKYNDIELICRDESKLEKFIAMGISINNPVLIETPQSIIDKKERAALLQRFKKQKQQPEEEITFE
jgi:hypothetical protein